MARPFIDFIFAQNVSWSDAKGVPGREGARIKVLSRDDVGGEISCILRLPAGFRTEIVSTMDEEIFVLAGTLQVGTFLLGRDHYLESPAGNRQRWCSEDGADLVLWRNAPDEDLIGSPIRAVDSMRMPWDVTHLPEGLEFLAPKLKVLKRGLDGMMRTFLLATPPHSYPKDFSSAALTHPCVEECFVLSGELSGPLGVMSTGSYFWRPPHIPHGPYGSRDGSLALFRWREGDHVNIWGATPLTLRFDAPYKPELPPELLTLHQTPLVPQRY